MTFTKTLKHYKTVCPKPSQYFPSLNFVKFDTAIVIHILWVRTWIDKCKKSNRYWSQEMKVLFMRFVRVPVFLSVCLSDDLENYYSVLIQFFLI